jgi:hypothetical protein
MLVELDEVIKFISDNRWSYEHEEFDGVLYYTGWDKLINDLKKRFEGEKK